MDKVKTGELIRDARKKKNYTQSELGDMLGVSNKAVSRWEKGDSFPDIGVLESLAHILDLKIQDIVIGEIRTSEKDSESEEITATEVVRMASVQIQSKSKKIVGLAFAAVIVICSIVAGITSMNTSRQEIVYYLLMITSLTTVVYGSFAPKYESDNKSGIDRLMIILSILTFAWMMIMVWCASVLVINGNIPFDMTPKNIGQVINIQLTAIIILNILLMLVGISRMGNEFRKLNYGFVFQTSSIYTAALYMDLFKRLSSYEGYIRNLAVRTAVVLVCTFLALSAMKLLKISRSSLLEMS